MLSIAHFSPFTRIWSLFFHQHPLHLVLQILRNVLFGPQELVVGPPLRVEGQHYAAGETAGFKGLDDIGCVVVASIQEIGIDNEVACHGFVAHAYLVAIPAAAGVGEVDVSVH